MRYEPDEAEGGMVAPVTYRGRGEFYIAAWRRAFHLFGVASRTEFWSFTLINLAIFVVLLVVSWRSVPEPNSGDFNYPALLLFVFVLAVPIPALTVSIRRIRDVTGSGWFALLLILTFTPFVGSVVGTLTGHSLRMVEVSRPSMGYGGVWRNTPDWIGRSSRTEFWKFILFNTLVFLGVLVALVIALAATGFPPTPFRTWGYVGFAEVLLVTIVILLAPTIPLVVRRVRDATGSGWVTIFSLLISMVNPILFFVVTVSPSRDAKRLERLSGIYSVVWRKTTDWVGVAKRAEFWPFTLINLTTLVAVAIFALSFNNSFVNAFSDLPTSPRGISPITVMLIWVPFIALSLPWFSLAVRRVRDSTGSGWWLLTGLIPYVGWIIVLVLCLAPTRDESKLNPSEPSDNGTCSSAENRQYDDDDPCPPQRAGTNGQ